MTSTLIVAPLRNTSTPGKLYKPIENLKFSNKRSTVSILTLNLLLAVKVAFIPCRNCNSATGSFITSGMPLLKFALKILLLSPGE